LTELITDLLTFSKVDKNKDDQYSSILLSEILNSVLLNLADSIKSKDAQIEIPKDNIMIKGRKSHLISLFQNLISNGIKYQNKGVTPIIKIQVISHENQHSISVSDNGIGISEEYFKEIFKPFKRLHGNGNYSGSGIGLATCKKILDQMGSDLVVSSTVNVGSKFTFQLPKG